MLINGITGFQEVCLPVKYLGVPLISTHVDFQPLIHKVKDRITSWLNNWLSFAGRL